MADKKMTAREFYNAVIKGEITAEAIEYAKDSIIKLDEKNDKRKNTLDKNQIANEEIIVSILGLLADKPMVASEIATALTISTQKASALCTKIVERGQATVSDLKVKNKGSVKQYTIVKE